MSACGVISGLHKGEDKTQPLANDTARDAMIKTYRHASGLSLSGFPDSSSSFLASRAFCIVWWNWSSAGPVL
jgi:hypothetical protein